MQWYFVAALLTILTSSQVRTFLTPAALDAATSALTWLRRTERISSTAGVYYPSLFPDLGILTKLSQNKDSTYDYDTATVPFLGEIFKLLVSCFFLWRENVASPTPLKLTKEWRSMRLFLVPSVIYLFHNNITFLTLKYLSPSTYQIMGNLKIITTGILFRIFLKRKLTKLQWIAILLLTIGTTTSQVKGCGDSMCESLLSGNITGYILAIVSAFLSAFGGVYTEYLLKKNNDSLYWQNIQLYTCGVFINMGWLIVGDFQSRFEKGFWWQHLFHGYTLTAWLVVANLASSGLLVSWLMKYADNIVKVYATSMAMLLTAVLSQFLFDVKATMQLLLGIIICMISLHLYFTPVHMLVDLPEIETPVRREEDP